MNHVTTTVVVLNCFTSPTLFFESATFEELCSSVLVVWNLCVDAHQIEFSHQIVCENPDDGLSAFCDAVPKCYVSRQTATRDDSCHVGRADNLILPSDLEPD